jgi:hypothetical protein
MAAVVEGHGSVVVVAYCFQFCSTRKVFGIVVSLFVLLMINVGDTVL